MASAQDRTSDIVDRLADYVLANGLGASSLRPLAAAAGTSDRMLLYYFKDKAELITAVLERVTGRLGQQLVEMTGDGLQPLPELRRSLFALMRSERLWPYTRLWLEIAALAAAGDATCRTVGELIARAFLAWGAARLDCPADQREAQSVRLLVSVEGMLLLSGVGLGDVCDAALSDPAI